MLLLLPQRYVFSSKSQPVRLPSCTTSCCYCYHKGTYFQANHNSISIIETKDPVVIATTKVRIFKQITTYFSYYQRTVGLLLLPQRYVFSSKSQHFEAPRHGYVVVIATTKVRIFKQITTRTAFLILLLKLLLLPQRYVFSSKSQHILLYSSFSCSCYCYHKGTYFQANHNIFDCFQKLGQVVIATTKVRIFKQITTFLTY